MDNKKEVKINLSTIIVLIFIIVLLIIACCLVISNSIKKDIAMEKQQQQIEELQSEVKDLNNAVNTTTINTENEDENTLATNKIINKKVTYGMIGVEKKPLEEDITYVYKFFDNKEEIDSIVKIIDNAKIYHEKSFIASFGDTPPIMTLYFEDGSPLHIMACDSYDDDGTISNLICIYYDEESNSDKTLYSVDIEFANYIEKLYQTVTENNVSKNKEIYGLIALSNLSSDEEKTYNYRYLVIEDDNIYFTNNLKDKVYEGTCKVLNNGIINIDLKEETQDLAFYTAAEFKKEYKDDIEFIKIENGDSYIQYEIIK